MDENEIHDIDEPFEPDSPPPQSERREQEGVPWAAILLGVWAIALVIFSVQNAEDATVHFLGWSFQTPVAILVIVTALVTLVITAIGSVFYRRRRRKKAELRRGRREEPESGE